MVLSIELLTAPCRRWEDSRRLPGKHDISVHSRTYIQPVTKQNISQPSLRRTDRLGHWFTNNRGGQRGTCG